MPSIRGPRLLRHGGGREGAARASPRSATAAGAAIGSARRSTTCSTKVDEHEGDVSKVTTADYRRIVDLCWQCKLCFNHCPYTPPHRWDIDFPRLMLRAKAARAKAEGVTRQDRWLGDVDAVGALGVRDRAARELGEPLQAAPRAAGGGGRRPPRPQPAAASTTRRSRAGSASGGGGRAARRPQGRALLLLLGQLQRAAGRTRRGGRAGEERLRGRRARSRSAAACRTSTAATSRAPPRTPSGTWRALLPLVEAGRDGGRARSRPAPTCSRRSTRCWRPGPDAETVAGRARATCSSTWPAASARARSTRTFPGRAPGQGRLPDALPPARAEHGLQDARRAAARFPGTQVQRDRALHGHGRHLGA